MSSPSFHPAITRWFNSNFKAATDVQEQSWSAINQGKHTLLAAPTGSGKTLAAFLSAIDQLIKEGLERGLEDETRVLYISPLKALSNDIQINLQQPLQGVRDSLLELGLHDVDARAWVRTGDTPQAERAKAIRTPPHILVTTPESIYIMLTSESGRKMLSTVQTVIIDEIHAIAGSKRGSHLTLSLERLEALTKEHNPESHLQRIGLSATQKPIETMAKFLVGDRDEECAIIDTGHSRERDLAIEMPASPLSAIMSNEIWEEIYARLEYFSNTHKSVLIFVNTRRLAERVAKSMADRIGEENVMAHHGSMAKEKRLEAEQRLKAGNLKCLVATASLELGIDIGDIDLVVQLGSPRSIAAFLQRVGRSGHAVGATPKGRIFPLSRDELVETTALLHAANQDDLDRVIIPKQPLDVLSQQIVAEVSAREWNVDELYQTFKKALPYAELAQKTFDDIIKMLADGFSTRRGRRGAYIHYDGINRRARPRKSARIISLTNGGAIPDQFDCDVVLQPEGYRIGSVGEDFAFESLPGDIFQLGNRSYRILKSEIGKVFVEDADGQPPNIPFWVGDALGRTDELSGTVSALRETVDELLDESEECAIAFLRAEYHLSRSAAEQLVAYLAAAKAALGLLPTQSNVLFERFFDEVGDMHFVIHSTFGSRINKAWGLALRKRFCRKFNFELQAAALEDSIVLSLSSTHSFPMEEVARYLNSKTVREVLIQAMLDAPVFPTRWRWNATISLAVLRNRFGRRSPPYFQRSDAEDLMAVVFPDQIACLENIAGEREIPDHPLVEQTIKDCLNETMDIDGLIDVLQKIETGKINITCCDLTSPSPLSQEVITAKPYAFLDDGEAEERRTMAIKSQPFMSTEDAASLRKLDNAAIDKVREEAWPIVRTADELHDALMVLGFILETEQGKVLSNSAVDVISNCGWQHMFDELANDSRAHKIKINHSDSNADILWVAAERLHEFLAVIPESNREITSLESTNNKQNVTPPLIGTFSTENPLLEILRSRLEGLGPVTAEQLGQPLGIDANKTNQVLLALEQEGFVIQGHFTRQNSEVEWCERRLLARIHRYTISRLRREIEPVSLANYMSFLFEWQGLVDKGEGTESLAHVLEQLEGISLSAAAWQDGVLPARIKNFSIDMLDSLCISGRINWLRLNVASSSKKLTKKKSPVKNTPIALLQRSHLSQWKQLAGKPDEYKLSPYAEKVAEALSNHGALFFFDIVQHTGILRTQVEDALGELVNWGLVTSDAYVGLRALITPSAKRPKFHARRGRSTAKVSPFDNAGRWSLIRQINNTETTQASLNQDEIEFIAWTLLHRYGVIFRKVLERENNLPQWRDLLRVYWRMEARGEIRGGRFVNGVSGEQFALPEALNVLRKSRKNNKADQSITISSADPLNLIGILLPGDKVPVTPLTNISFINGVPVVSDLKLQGFC
ncbi:DEAD/DEAH box helicase [Cocleimonas flava]|uniref:Lhr family ATP dependent helicase n=1 Tax=Cocleimonas flava TaxID=634765 RepID=A0A4R1F953_9GAMM|nr:DEAD/DEAH box helicase [Cocleimonas flava]TCJ89284.1 Lhr family ATP dependent helicase [Cocleimonas flava]